MGFQVCETLTCVRVFLFGYVQYLNPQQKYHTRLYMHKGSKYGGRRSSVGHQLGLARRQGSPQLDLHIYFGEPATYTNQSLRFSKLVMSFPFAELCTDTCGVCGCVYAK